MMPKFSLKIFSLFSALVCMALTQPILLSQKLPAPTASTSIYLTISYGDDAEKRFTLPFRKEMSVLDAMKAAQANPHGIRFETKTYPKGELVTQIDDLVNQGPEPNQK